MVVFKAGCEQKHVLLHHGDRTAQRLHGDVSNVLSVNCNPAACRVIESRDKVGDCGFSAARRANQTDRFATLRLKTEVPKRWPIILTGVGKVDILKPQQAVRDLQFFGVR